MDSKYLILTTVLKTLEVYLAESGEQIANMYYWIHISLIFRKLEKKCSAILTQLYNGKEYLIIGDKVGDVIAFDLPSLQKKTYLLGHCATVITDLVSFGNYLASSDRDEKVFINHFPQTFNIQSICVGHKQYVSCIANVAGSLISGSADGTLRKWDIESGVCTQIWYLDELLVNLWFYEISYKKIESEEEVLLIPSQILPLQNTQFAVIVEE